MMNKSIELYKVKREIKMHGSTFTVKRNKIDEYKEPTGEPETITAFRGLFHITKTFQTRTVKDGTVTRTKGQPMVLAEYSDVEEIRNGDIIEYNGLKYTVADVNNVEQMNIIADISTELIMNGNI